MRVTGSLLDRVLRLSAAGVWIPALFTPYHPMAAPRPSNAAETARQPTQVWVPDVKEGYLPGWVHSEDEEAAEVVMESGEVCMPLL